MSDTPTYPLADFMTLIEQCYGDLDDSYDNFADEDPRDHQVTKLALMRLCAQAIDLMGVTDCALCGVDAFAIGEDFYVHNQLWAQYGATGGTGVLCVGCLEKIMGRQLNPGDFTGAPYMCVECVAGGMPANDLLEHCPHMSVRLRDRIGVQYAKSAVPQAVLDAKSVVESDFARWRRGDFT